MQRRLSFGRQESEPPTLRQRREFDQSNFEAAVIILSDADRYGGEAALSVIWARKFLARYHAEHGTATKKAAA